MQPNFLPLSQLKDMLESSQNFILKELESTSSPSEEFLNEIGRLAFHEAYHAGQIGLLRRLIGKEGQIK